MLMKHASPPPISKPNMSMIINRKKKSCRTNVCIFPIHSMKSQPPSLVVPGGVAFGRWLCHGCGALTNRMSALTNGVSGNSLAPSTMWGHKKLAGHTPEEGAPQSLTDHAATDLGFPASRTVGSKFPWFTSHHAYGCFSSVN